MNKKTKPAQLQREINAAIKTSHIESSGLIGLAESARIDDLTTYVEAILGRLHGEELDSALAGEVRRAGRGDVAFRAAAVSNTHPDDLVAALVKNGYSLSSVGLESVKRGRTT